MCYHSPSNMMRLGELFITSGAIRPRSVAFHTRLFIRFLHVFTPFENTMTSPMLSYWPCSQHKFCVNFLEHQWFSAFPIAITSFTTFTQCLMHITLSFRFLTSMNLSAVKGSLSGNTRKVCTCNVIFTDKCYITNAKCRYHYARRPVGIESICINIVYYSDLVRCVLGKILLRSV